MGSQRHRIRNDETVEWDRLRFVVSGEYAVFSPDGEWGAVTRWLPTWVDFELHGQDEPNFHCRIELRESVPRVVELGWRASENQGEIRQKHLRDAEVSAIANLVYGTWVVELKDVWPDKDGTALPAKFGTEQARKIQNFLLDLRSGRRHVNAELLRQVADVYRENFDKAPAEAVARTFNVKPRMAHEYVRRARERGFLPPTTQGKKKA